MCFLLGNDVDESIAKGNPRVFVGNLAFSVSEDELWELFGSCGEITQVRMGKSGLVDMLPYFLFQHIWQGYLVRFINGAIRLNKRY